MQTKKRAVLIWSVGVLLLTLLDQMTKQWIEQSLPAQGIDLWPGVFRLQYLQNRGAAFGMLQGKGLLFALFAIVIMGISLGYFVHLGAAKRSPLLMRIALVMLAAGALGNMIDRIWRGYVVDFLYFSWINFPIFNVADIYVTVSSAMLLLSLLLYSEEDLEVRKDKS